MRMMMLLMIFIVSCQSIPPSRHCDISFNPKERCRCRCFDYNNLTRLEDKECGDDFHSGNFPIEYCDGIGGPFPADYKKIRAIYLKNAEYCKDIEGD